MISIRDLSKSFGTIQALNGLNLNIPRSKITILAGADGSGKSTLIRILLGLLKPDRGEIFLDNKIIGDEISKISNIAGFMPESFSLYPDLSVEENLNFFADIYSLNKKKREFLKDKLLEKTGMIEFKKRRTGALSGGMKQKLALSSILLSSPELIFLDEPTTGVDPLSRIEFFKIIQELKNSGKTIIISTPYLDEAEEGDYIVFIKDGKVILSDTIEGLKKQFPLELLRLKPKGNIFKSLKEMKLNWPHPENLYIRGKYINYLMNKGEKIPTGGYDHFAREKVGLEDIYIYFERRING